MVSRGRDLTKHYWIWVVVVCFAVVYLASLRFQYVEGDDASSLAYHLYERNDTIQPPYSPYHSMMDAVLSLLPANEPLLRTIAVALTSVSAVALVLFVLALVFDWMKDFPLAPRWITALVVLFASPEFFYLGLAYLPGVIAMALVLGAHVILRRGLSGDEPPELRPGRRWAAVILSAVVFGIGAACRWDITVYGAVIAVDLVFGYGNRRGRLLDMIRRRWSVCLVWGVLALIGFFTALAISGYGPTALIDQIQKYQGFLEERNSRLIETIGSIQPLLTPAFGLSVVAGLIALIRRRDPLLIVVAAGLIVVAPWASRGVPKFILPAVPGLVACSVIGFSAIWTQIKPERWQPVIRLAMGALLLAPWLVGVQVLLDDSAFGPGFESRPYDRPTVSTQVSLGILKPGALFPTSEGPRGLFGHASVLLGGEWIKALDERWVEMENAVDYAIQRDMPFISTGNISNFVVLLWLRGYSTQDPRDPPGYVKGDLVRRTFTSSAGHTLAVFNQGVDVTRIERLSALPVDLNQIVIYGFPRTMRALYETAPDALLEKLGPVSALLDLTRLRSVIEQTATS